jgi:CubicO group peptidase (beta-lactamase class C family)
MTYQDLPGLSLAIVHDQEIVWSRDYGFADRERRVPVTSETIYRIGSISKLFTSIAILMLRDDGKLRLDDRVDSYLPWFQPKNTYTDAPPIMVRHLLSHTSGLPGEPLSSYWTTFDFPSSTQIIDGIKRQDLVLPTQSRFKYSNLGFAIAGELVAEVAGIPFEEYVNEQILKPLSMNNTFTVLPKEIRDRLATGYGRRRPDGARREFPYSETRGITAAAGFSSTVNDLARLASWH